MYYYHCSILPLSTLYMSPPRPPPPLSRPVLPPKLPTVSASVPYTPSPTTALTPFSVGATLPPETVIYNVTGRNVLCNCVMAAGEVGPILDYFMLPPFPLSSLLSHKFFFVQLFFFSLFLQERYLPPAATFLPQSRCRVYVPEGGAFFTTSTLNMPGAGGHLFFCGHSSAVDEYGARLLFSIRRLIPSIHFHLLLKCL